MNHERKAFQNYSLSLHPFGFKHTVDVKKNAGNVFSHKILSQNYLCQATINLFNLISNFPKKIIKKILVEFVSFFFVNFQICSQNDSSQYTRAFANMWV